MPSSVRPPLRGHARWRQAGSQVARRVGAHGPFLALLALGALLRLLVLVAFRPVLWFYGDSYGYLGVAVHPSPYDVRPTGYSFFLELLQPLHRLAVVAAAQHLIGLGVGVGVYAVLHRLGVRRWLATLAAAPVLLDAFGVGVEQTLLAETLFLGLVMPALLALVWPRGRPGRPGLPGVAACGWVGLLLALGVLTRTVGLALVAVAVTALVARRAGPRRLAAALVAFTLPLLLYASWFNAVHHRYELTASNGFFLYGRVVQLADCAGMDLPAAERPLCPPEPPGQRREVEYYVWNRASPAWTLPYKRVRQDELAADFARRVMRAQPLDYAAAVGLDLAHSVAPGRSPYPSDFTYSNYLFRTTYPPVDPSASESARLYQGGVGDGNPNPVAGLARPLRAYQAVGYVPGPVYGLAILVGLAGLVLGRDRTGRRSATFLFLAAGAAMLVVPALTAAFDYRYQLPALPMLAIAAALGAQLLLDRRRRPRHRAGASPAASPAASAPVADLGPATAEEPERVAVG